MSRKILVGSSVFFNEIEGFKPKDRDYVILDEKPVGYAALWLKIWTQAPQTTARSATSPNKGSNRRQ